MSHDERPKPITEAMLRSYLVREGDGRFALFFCRGPGKCTRSALKLTYSKKQCADCVRGRDDETIEQLAARVARGDA